jgi:hypothetical protein
VAKNGEEGARPKTTLDLRRGFGNAKKAKEQNLKIQCGRSNVYLSREHRESQQFYSKIYKET